MKLTKSGAFTGTKIIGATYMSTELQAKLNNMSLADAQSADIINAEKFVEVTKTYSGEKGVESYSHLELVTDKGNVVLSTALGDDIADWEDKLGDLVFKQFMTSPEKTNGRAAQLVFRLQKPGGGVVEERTDLEIGQ